ncbi:MAG: MurR/RpiR family transcriptional regulator [Paracoccaceae bacterium]|nr:MurR/RpiR family transcriptional regulator [Paracoccaceae bacterium]
MERSETLGIEDSLLEVIARAREELRPSDNRVADAILAAPAAVVDMTLAELARTAEVSEPTVLRFCAAVGCEGFRDMRVKLARSLAFARATSHSRVTPEDGLDAIIEKMFDFNLSNLTWVRSRLDPQAIAAAVEAILVARRIVFFGFGASAIVAEDAAQKFPLFGIPCNAPLDGHQLFMSAHMMEPGDVAVGISNTGTTREVVEALALARGNGATTIGICGDPDGPALAACDIAIVVETLENTDLYTPTISRLSALVVVDILSTAVSLARGEDHHARVAAMKDGLARYRTGGTG